VRNDRIAENNRGLSPIIQAAKLAEAIAVFRVEMTSNEVTA
jgi:hypothetical protein